MIKTILLQKIPNLSQYREWRFYAFEYTSYDFQPIFFIVNSFSLPDLAHRNKDYNTYRAITSKLVEVVIYKQNITTLGYFPQSLKGRHDAILNKAKKAA